MYKTEDGYELQDGEKCFVMIQCADGTHKLSQSIRQAVYMNENCKYHGWDFEVSNVRSECQSIEIVGCWKNKP
jgi:hypothetical protein